jgi:hypothetical protein
MSKGLLIKKDIIDYIEKIREEYIDVTNDMLLADGAIFYMNGNDGTDFDWDMNGRCCEFFVFYKDTENGFIKVIITIEDIMYAYVYDDEANISGTRIEPIELESGDAQYLASLLIQEADNKDIFDENIENINFDIDVKEDDVIHTPYKKYHNDDYDDYNENDEFENEDYDHYNNREDDYGNGDWDDYD